ncbi:cell wall elongation regulator TseB-like domain-containing protein [Limosilactobacillus kribbianus]|uniref:cell wall elongation regulator TseB-like domain-containing protein n=1 Tax=Limosilactobacillus kribbianus TaxID=2982695 RepID=UPI002265098F|nr:DUF5590 domain-containing protein [Limosilactobacillus kribbianus]
MQSRREVQREQNRGSALRTIRNILLTILILLLVGWSVYAVANQPRAAARRQTVTMAEKYAHLHSPGHFYIFNRESTYYTITGRNQSNQPILVIVPQHGGNIRVVKQSSGVTEKQVRAQTKANRKPAQILKVAPGIFNDKVVWEVTYRSKKGKLSYDLINFKTGRYVQNINNL